MFDEMDDLAPLTEEEEKVRIIRRCTYLCQTFESYNAKLAKIGLGNATMNKALLLNAVESYFLDIRRLKTFHGMERADRFKISGFFLK